MWGESYAGHYIPVYADYFEHQNDRIASGTDATSEIEIHIETVGLVNACIDFDTQTVTYPEFAFNNTYGIKAINESYYESAIEFTETCLNMSATCRALADEKDPLGLGNDDEVNKACAGANLLCFEQMHDGFTAEVSSPIFYMMLRS